MRRFCQQLLSCLLVPGASPHRSSGTVRHHELAEEFMRSMCPVFPHNPNPSKRMSPTGFSLEHLQSCAVASWQQTHPEQRGALHASWPLGGAEAQVDLSCEKSTLTPRLHMCTLMLSAQESQSGEPILAGDNCPVALQGNTGV